MQVENIFQALPAELEQEAVEELLSAGLVRLERIVSRGHSSPPGFWYDQADNEWVMLLRGRARLAFEGGDELALEPGSHVNIPAHTRHRVQWTQPDSETIWLALFY